MIPAQPTQPDILAAIDHIERVCLVCGRMAPVVNYGRENGREVGYLGRHWRPGIRRDAKCSGSFGGWVGR